MKKFFAVILSVCLALTVTACSKSDEEVNGGEDVVRVGILQLVEHPALDAATKGFKEGLAAKGYIDGENLKFDIGNAQNDMSNCETIATKYVNDRVDLIFANATPAAQACAAKTDSIPIVITSVTDPETAGLVETNEQPNTNITGTSDLTPVSEQIKLLFEVVPDAKTVAVMYCSSEDNSIYQKDVAIKALNEAGIKTIEASVSDTTTIQSVTESLLGKVDAIYIGTDNLLSENMGAVTNITNENKIPVIVGERGEVENGGFATYGVDYYNLGYKAGEMAAEILEGKDPKDMPIYYLPEEKCELVINETTMKELGLELSQEILDRAELIK